MFRIIIALNAVAVYFNILLGNEASSKMESETLQNLHLEHLPPQSDVDSGKRREIIVKCQWC